MMELTNQHLKVIWVLARMTLHLCGYGMIAASVYLGSQGELTDALLLLFFGSWINERAPVILPMSQLKLLDEG